MGYLSIEVIDYSARRGIQLLIREILSLYVSGRGHLCSSPPYISNLSLQDCVVACHELQSEALGLIRSCSLYVRLNIEEVVGQSKQYAWQLCNKQVGHLQPVQWIYRVACVQNPCLISTNFGEAPVESMYGAAIITLEYVVTAVVEEPVTPRLTWLESLPNRACQPVVVKFLAQLSTAVPPPPPCATGTLLSIVIGLISCML